uniref:Anion permease n=1 Tax=candidate division WOR-3 bacterium TaxID=2052148 RepID=A0A7V5Y0A0_UNCW3
MTILIFILFFVCYLLMAIFFKFRLYILYGFLFSFLFLGFSLRSYFSFVDFNVVLLFLGTFIIAEGFFLSKIPEKIAFHLANKSGSLVSSIILFTIFSGFLSIFLENACVVLILAPIAFSLAQTFKTSPLNFIIPLCLASNLQGSATLIGDPPSMILAEKANLDFLDFFIFNGKPSLFFIIQFGFLFSLLTIYLILLTVNRQPLSDTRCPSTVDHQPLSGARCPSTVFLIILVLFILSLAIVPKFLKGNNYLFYAAIISLFYAFLTLFFLFYYQLLKPRDFLKVIDYETVLFLVGVFVLIGVFKEGGGLLLLKDFLKVFFSKKPIIIVYVFIILFSLLFSSFMDNVPFFLLISEVIKLFYPEGKLFYLFLFAALIASTIGGNITPFGAQANIVAVGYLKRKGIAVSFFDFFKLGLPFSLAGTVASTFLLYLLYG